MDNSHYFLLLSHNVSGFLPLVNFIQYIVFLSYLQLKLRPLFPKSTNVFSLSFEHLQPPEALKTSEEVGTSQKSLSISILDNQIFRDLSVTFFFVLMMETCREKEGG